MKKNVILMTAFLILLSFAAACQTSKSTETSAGDKPSEKSWKFSAEDNALIETNVARTVVEVIKRNAKEIETVHPQMNLEIDLGLDSLARAETFAALENAFATEFEADEAAQALTVRDVVALIEKHVGAIDENQAISANLNWSKIVRNADDNFPEVQSALKNRPIFISFVFAVYKTFNLFCKGFMRLEVQNIENLQSLEKPFLICPNHQSFLDPFVLCGTYDFDKFRNTFHVGASYFFGNRFMQWVAGMLQTVPVDPDAQLMKAMKAGAIGLKRGRILNIYPEGERGFDGDLHDFKKGAAILATELDLPILPVALDGLHKVWARSTWKIRPAKVKVRFGKPFYAKEITTPEMTDEQKYEVVITHLRDEIALMIEELRK